MFMNYVAHRADRRRFNLASAASLTIGLVFATLVALVGLASAASAAAPVAMVDTDALARMLVAPDLYAPLITREVLLGLMSAGLVVMSVGALALWRGLERDWQAGSNRR